ncbi:phage tail assembly chaperone [Nitrospirillum sp. BR 11164]|uniref:phage tail assembly chaperone n=1 Tax=Nitrospirillum sp. BR 11164 TaxID=3104324 RepID=UPI002AFDDBA4|nr:phage tail assembly chaperone [Nitrospirillum sp. BR 11164]MEA1651846.1 phage tail assembly chaperone [Nitrospirillum sp. BR 11164]
MTDTPALADAAVHFYVDYDPATGRVLALHHRDPLSPLEEGIGGDGIGRLKIADDQADGIWSCRVVDGALAPRDVADLAAAAQVRALGTLREQRDLMLSASDIRVLPDRWAAMTDAQRAAWTAYRQALRDLPATTTDPAAVAWPVPPS